MLVKHYLRISAIIKSVPLFPKKKTKGDADHGRSIIAGTVPRGYDLSRAASLICAAT